MPLINWCTFREANHIEPIRPTGGCGMQAFIFNSYEEQSYINQMYSNRQQATTDFFLAISIWICIIIIFLTGGKT